MQTICWRCGGLFFPNSETGNCIKCARSEDEEHERMVEAKKLEHDLCGSNLKSYGSDKVYKIRHKLKKMGILSETA